MRNDMFKVIVERPRLVNSNGYSSDGRRYRNNEDAPAFLGMKRGYGRRKWLNENLAPLQRYLAKQVNRPWGKVYSEIRATIDGRSTVQQPQHGATTYPAASRGLRCAGYALD